ncbi:MAG TPA: hypothetical protein VH500_10665 [Nitrososphaeraceae archaeon]|jgi:hypothetical protein
MNKFEYSTLGSAILIILSFSILPNIRIVNNAFADSVPSVAFNPFTGNSQYSSQSTLDDSCQTDDNCGGVNGEVITKTLDDMLTKDILPLCDNTQPECQDLKAELMTGESAENMNTLPESENCGEHQEHDENGMVDENCESITNQDTQSYSTTPIPEQELCGDSEDNDGNGEVDENCDATDSDLDRNNAHTGDTGEDSKPVGISDEKKTDKFGIQKLYPTKPDGEQWYMRSDHPEKDPQFRPQVSLSKNDDGSFKVTDEKIRMGVWPSTGNHPEKITTYDEKELEEKGYMESPSDWRNVEITGYVKFNKGVDDDNFAWYARGGLHTDGKNCEGTAYKGQLYYSGKTRFAKEQWFVSYVFSPYEKSMDSLEGKWVGFKTVMYNFHKDGGLAVKLEIWLDESNNGNWKKVYDYVDDGGWGNEGDECGGRPDQIISWGGPLAVFRWDNAFDVDIKDFSVREIQPDT